MKCTLLLGSIHFIPYCVCSFAQQKKTKSKPFFKAVLHCPVKIWTQSSKLLCLQEEFSTFLSVKSFLASLIAISLYIPSSYRFILTMLPPISQQQNYYHLMDKDLRRQVPTWLLTVATEFWSIANCYPMLKECFNTDTRILCNKNKN